MASPFVPSQIPVQFARPRDHAIRQDTSLRQCRPPQAQSNQCDDAGSTWSATPVTVWPDQFKPGNAPPFVYSAPECDGDANVVKKLREENRALHARIEELNRSHQLQVSCLQHQLAEANAAHQAAEQRLVAAAAATQTGWQAVDTSASTTSWYSSVPLCQQQPLAPSTHSHPPHLHLQQQQQQQQQRSPQQHRFHPYARQQQPQQTPPAPSFNGQSPQPYPHATPALTSQAPVDNKRATGGLLAYCSGFISASLPSSVTGSASAVPSTGLKVAPSWTLFGRSRASEDDEETGGGASVLPLKAPSTGLGGPLRDPAV